MGRSARARARRAAGLLALAGSPEDLEVAARALHTALGTDSWRHDRSYLWSMFVDGMATAAATLGERKVCTQLLDDLAPLAGSCGVNGALVCFMGSNAHWAGVLAAALGRTQDARRWFDQALATHQRIGAPSWQAETHLELAQLGGDHDHRRAAAQVADQHGLHGITARLGDSPVTTPPSPAAPAPAAKAELRRAGQLWQIRYHETTAHLPDLEGLGDLATLLAPPGHDMHVLDLAGAGSTDPDSGPLLDTTARAAYRQRLTELDAELATAHDRNDLERAHRLRQQHDALIAQLARAAGRAGHPRALGTSTTERARKAVTARLRGAIQHITELQPELGAHLQQSVLTGTTCRYQPTTPITWAVDNHQKATSPRRRNPAP